MNKLFIVALFLFSSIICSSQEIEVFTRNDYNLKGNVKEIFSDENELRLKFDSTGKLTELSFGKYYANDVTKYKYDTLGRVLERKYINNYTSLLEYWNYYDKNVYSFKSYMDGKLLDNFICYTDQYDNITEARDTNNQIIYYYKNNYDRVGKIIKKSLYYTAEKDPSKTFQFVYDESFLLKYTILGLTIYNNKYKDEISYNRNGQVTEDIKIINAEKKSKKTIFTYDDFGLLIKTEKFDGPEFTNSYEEMRYSDYVLDSNGNWISRKLSFNQQIQIHTRTIVYY